MADIGRSEAPLYQAQYGHFINADWVEGDSGKTIDLMNPTNGQVLSRIAAGNAKDVERAVMAATNAFKSWSQSSAGERQELLVEIARRLKNRLADYAMLETLNNGKPLRESLNFDLPQAIGQFELFAGAAFQKPRGGFGLHGGLVTREGEHGVDRGAVVDEGEGLEREATLVGG